MAEAPPGEIRLAGMYGPDAGLDFGGVPADAPEYIIAKIIDTLEEGAADGAILVEIRFGLGSVALRRADFMELFREAERQAQTRYPQLCAEAFGFLSLVNDK
jgi:hypothetical protein